MFSLQPFRNVELKNMFGDLFNTRRDYSGGLFYAGSRKYLINSDNKIEPPHEFKTKKQIRKFLRTTDTRKIDPMINLRTQRDGHSISFLRQTDKPEKSKNISIFKKVGKSQALLKKMKESSIVMERSLDQSHWKESFQAGCRIWVNSYTGEVLDTCPWEISGDGKTTSNDNNRLTKILESEKVELGTGALVYDQVETLNLFDLLDNMKL